MSQKPLTRASMRSKQVEKHLVASNRRTGASCSVVLSRAMVQNFIAHSQTTTITSKTTAKNQSRKVIIKSATAEKAARNRQPATPALPICTSPRARKTCSTSLYQNIASQKVAQTARYEQANGRQMDVSSLRTTFEDNLTSFMNEFIRINDLYARNLSTLETEYAVKIIELKQERQQAIADARKKVIDFWPR